MWNYGVKLGFKLAPTEDEKQKRNKHNGKQQKERQRDGWEGKVEGKPVSIK